MSYQYDESTDTTTDTDTGKVYQGPPALIMSGNSQLSPNVSPIPDASSDNVQQIPDYVPPQGTQPAPRMSYRSMPQSPSFLAELAKAANPFNMDNQVRNVKDLYHGVRFAANATPLGGLIGESPDEYLQNTVGRTDAPKTTNNAVQDHATADNRYQRALGAANSGNQAEQPTAPENQRPSGPSGGMGEGNDFGLGAAGKQEQDAAQQEQDAIRNYGTQIDQQAELQKRAIFAKSEVETTQNAAQAEAAKQQYALQHAQSTAMQESQAAHKQATDEFNQRYQKAQTYAQYALMDPAEVDVNTAIVNDKTRPHEERAVAQAALQKASQVNPNRLMGSARNVVIAAISSALGALGQAFGGGPNKSLESINAAIDRDVMSQREAFSAGEKHLGRMNNDFARQRQAWDDDDHATQALTAQRYGEVAAQLNQQLAETKDPEASANLQTILSGVTQKQQEAQQGLKMQGSQAAQRAGALAGQNAMNRFQLYKGKAELGLQQQHLAVAQQAASAKSNAPQISRGQGKRADAAANALGMIDQVAQRYVVGKNVGGVGGMASSALGHLPLNETDSSEYNDHARPIIVAQYANSMGISEKAADEAIPLARDPRFVEKLKEAQSLVRAQLGVVSNPANSHGKNTGGGVDEGGGSDGQ